MSRPSAGVLLLIDLAGVVMAALLAMLAARGPEAVTVAEHVGGPIIEVSLTGEPRVPGGLQMLLVILHGHTRAFTFPATAEGGGGLKLALERGRWAELAVDRMGAIVAATVDGRPAMSEETVRGTRHGIWRGELLVLLMLLSLFVFLRPVERPGLVTRKGVR